MIGNRIRPNFAALLVLAWALVAAWLLTQFWTSAATVITDPDDAMRLSQVREFLAGKGWFDLAEPRVDPPYGYLTHWSRLIDLGLAGLFMLARGFLSAPMAERVMIEIWPVLWLLPAIGGVAAIAWRCGGRDAAFAVLVLAIFGLPAFQHFQPGRIDHHNVQIALAILTVAAAAWSDRVNWASVAAGLLSALALAVGLESLPWIVLAGTAIALRFIVSGTAAGALRGYSAALAGGTLALFVATVEPAHWFVNACDALAVNLALPVIIAGAMLALGSIVFTQASFAARLGIVAVCAAVAMVLFVKAEPACIYGPYALVDPAVKQTWLSHVEEMSPLVGVLRTTPVSGTWVAAFPCAALLVSAILAGTPLRRDFAFLLAAAALLTAAILTLAMVKTYSYAMWFGMPVVAVGVAWFCVRLRLSKALWAPVALVLTPVMISAGAISIAQASVSQPQLPSQREACFRIDAYEPLAKLPSGLIVANVDFGPALLAFTGHSVLAAPYHRISHGILAAQHIFSSPPDAAKKLLAEVHADYVVLCGTSRLTGLDKAALNGGLWARLTADEIPGWLEPVPLPEGNPFIVYRVKS